MEVFDQPPKSYPDSLREAYGDLLNDPAAMARYCVEKLGAEVISVRLLGTHPDNGDKSPGGGGRGGAGRPEGRRRAAHRHRARITSRRTMP